MIYQELLQGTPVFKVHDDGTETVEYKPPTSKELRAAREIERLRGAIQLLQTQLHGHFQPAEEVTNETST